MNVMEKRRSDRMNVTVPVAVEGVDAEGRLFKDDAQALVISRFGGRIRLGHRLERGQQLLVVGPRNPTPAVFEVVETVVAASDDGGEYGMVCLDRAEDVWGIRVWGETEEPSDAKALLECQMCRTVGFVPLSLTQVDAIRYLGFVGLPCLECQATTPWGYAEVKAPKPPDGSKGEAAAVEGLDQFTPRKHRRVYVQLALKVKADNGAEEFTHTENVSRSGLGFLSARRYDLGEMVYVQFPHDPARELPARRARIRYRRAVEGSGNSIYGLEFVLGIESGVGPLAGAFEA
jgi:PilZ domain-containing protein